MSTSLIRNTNSRLAPRAQQPLVLDKVSYHIQQAMQVIRDDPCGDLAWEQHCTKIYHLLHEAMKLVVTQPRAHSALQSDLAAVMGGVDGTTQVPQVRQDEPTTIE